jgi:phosphodiester glycosidase
VVLTALGLGGCAGRGRLAEAPALPFATDSFQEHTLRPGVHHRFWHSGTGPWAINVLQVELDRCYRAIAVKGAAGAVGREKTSLLLGALARSHGVVGGSNADFFLFNPPGVPQGALISEGRVISGPSGRPVLAFDSSGAPHITTLRVTGSVSVGSARFELAGWNRAVPEGLALFDAGWGTGTDTASASIEVVLGGAGATTVLSIDTLSSGVTIPREGRVLVAGRAAAAALRGALLALRPGAKLSIELRLLPFHPREAVGGRPVLLRDSVQVEFDPGEGQAGFAATRHPRTAVGIARGGKRLLLVVVDGRQQRYSDGMSLPELASLLLALGARDAINLDGGGSTTLLYADPDSAGALRIANRPSDREGERPVGDALAIVLGCGRR